MADARYGNTIALVAIHAAIAYARSSFHARTPAGAPRSFAPHDGRGHVEVTERRTASDVAHELRTIADVYVPEAGVTRLVWDRLNVHTLAVVYPAFPPAEARRIARKLELHYTPEHGSRLDMTGIGAPVLSRQCPGQRLSDRVRVERAVDAREEDRNQARATVVCRFTSETVLTRSAAAPAAVAGVTVVAVYQPSLSRLRDVEAEEGVE